MSATCLLQFITYMMDVKMEEEVLLLTAEAFICVQMQLLLARQNTCFLMNSVFLYLLYLLLMNVVLTVVFTNSFNLYRNSKTYYIIIL